MHLCLACLCELLSDHLQSLLYFQRIYLSRKKAKNETAEGDPDSLCREKRTA